ncbi:hypothetical protein QR680_008356 [Steinernema hermaphroditum]|uniref:Uncharacterized protein n=1 Tax=Steinernema hermaphroditum TaxID=289476 RepID=A0AA39IGC9_9BILA|nr:hypothetical protein QR680_008356 [Steinernema hermaphroditum]
MRRKTLFEARTGSPSFGDTRGDEDDLTRSAKTPRAACSPKPVYLTHVEFARVAVASGRSLRSLSELRIGQTETLWQFPTIADNKMSDARNPMPDAA